ncbi:MAG: C45 family peptidase [Dehalococcoidales bacterium]
MAAKLPVISVKGKPFECGEQYGSQAESLIRRNAGLYFDMWKKLWGAGHSDIVQRCHPLIDVIGDYDADLLDELGGIARGAGLDLEEIIALNARYEINSSLGILCKQGSDGCTSVAALPPVTVNGHTLLGQNWDWLVQFQESTVLLMAEQTGKPNVVTQPEAGVLAHRGMNSAGIGVCFNGIASNQDNFESGTPPFLVVARAILNSANFSGALEAVLGMKATMSGNFLIAHGDGEAVDLEVSPADTGILYAEGDILTHSNHFISFADRADFTDLLKTIYPDTLLRHRRARQILEPGKSRIDVGSFQKVFGDHFSYPKSICRHTEASDTGLKGWATLSSMIMDLTEGTVYIAEGPPCRNSYYRLTPEILRRD